MNDPPKMMHRSTKEIDAGLNKFPIDDDLIKDVKEFLDEKGIDVTATLKDVVKKLK